MTSAKTDPGNLPPTMLSLSDIRDLISTRKWESFLGQPEGLYLDCKKSGYRLDEPAQKQELAKDVSSFANAGGGFILIGVETKASSTHPTDEILRLRAFSKEHFNAKQYRDILRDWVHPEIEGLDVVWLAKTPKGSSGFGVVTIPPQEEHRKPFMMIRAIQEGGRVGTLLLGFAQRVGEVSQPASPKDVARWLSDGRNYQARMESRLELLQASIEGFRAEGQTRDEPSESAAARLDDALIASGLSRRPHYALAAWPQPRSQPRTILSANPESITAVLQRAQTLRHAGWSLETFDQARLVGGKFRELRSGDRKVLRLYRDGMLVFGGSAAHDFLGWADPAEYQARPRITSLALIELTYLFCLMYSKVVKDLTVPPRTHAFEFRLGRMQTGGPEQPVRLSAAKPDSVSRMWDLNMFPASCDSSEHVLEVSQARFKPKRVAFEIIQEVYAWFGADTAHIPFTALVDGETVISPEEIALVGR